MALIRLGGPSNTVLTWKMIHGAGPSARPKGAGVTEATPEAGADGTGTIAGRIGRCDPTATRPAPNATSMAAGGTRTTSGRRLDRGDCSGAGVTTAVTRATGSTAAARISIVSHRSGAGTVSRLAKRRRRSSIAVSQEFSEAAPAAAQVGPNRQTV